MSATIHHIADNLINGNITEAVLAKIELIKAAIWTARGLDALEKREWTKDFFSSTEDAR